MPSAGFASATIESRSVADNRVRVLYDNGTIRSGDPVEVEGILLGRPEPSFDGVFLTLRVEGLRYRGVDHNVSGRVRLFMPDTAKAETSAAITDLRSQISDLKYGSRLRIACKLNREDAFLNPGVIPRKDVLDRLGIDASGSVKSPLLIEHIADESVFLPLAWVYDQRARLIEAFRANLSPRAAGVMIASLLGDKYFLDKETADLFRDGGTFHILVISGLHITFIGGLLLLFLRRLTRDRRIQFGVTTAVLWAYTLAVGADVPVVRAAVMFTAVLAAYVIYRQVSLLNSLGISSLVLLVWRPSDLFDPSFQLTFVSVAAIVTMAVPLVDKLQKIGSWTPIGDGALPAGRPGAAQTLLRNDLLEPGRLGGRIQTPGVVRTHFQIAVSAGDREDRPAAIGPLRVRRPPRLADRAALDAAPRRRLFSPRFGRFGLPEHLGRHFHRRRRRRVRRGCTRCGRERNDGKAILCIRRTLQRPDAHLAATVFRQRHRELSAAGVHRAGKGDIFLLRFADPDPRDRGQ